MAEQDWVLCSEKLPDIWERVLVVIDSNRYKSIHTAELQSIEEKSWLVEGEYWYEGEDAKQITHWRPIPGLPNVNTVNEDELNSFFEDF